MQASRRDVEPSKVGGTMNNLPASPSVVATSRVGSGWGLAGDRLPCRGQGFLGWG